VSNLRLPFRNCPLIQSFFEDCQPKLSTEDKSSKYRSSLPNRDFGYILANFWVVLGEVEQLESCT